MARLLRLVVPCHPHHIIQRGNRREQIFFNNSDYEAYLEFLRDALAVSKAKVWALKFAGTV